MARHNTFLLVLSTILGLDSGYMGIELWMMSDLFPLNEWISKCEWFVEFCCWETAEESWILTTWVLAFIQSVCWVRLSLNRFYTNRFFIIKIRSTYSIFISLLETDPLDTIDHTEIASSGTQKGNMATILGIENRFLVSAKLWKEVQNISLSHLF